MTVSPFLARLCSPLRHALAGSLLLLFATAPAGAQATPGALQAVSYGSTVDLAAGIATFAIRFDRAPDFFTLDQAANPADAFQIWTDTVSTNPQQSAYAGIFGNGPLGTQAVITSIDIADTNQLTFLWPQLVTDRGPDDYTWGTLEGRAGYTLAADNTVSFEVPLALLRAADGHFNYGFETYQNARWGGVEYFGASGLAYPLPEPSSALLVAAGLAWLVAGRRAARRVR
jgi:hypothetical protein